VFRSTRRDGTVENELKVERASITYRTTSYSRWDAVWGRARIYFDALLPTYVAQGRVLGISLNYVDKFFWRGEVRECRPSLLLRPTSNYLCPHVYDAEDLWHSHTGAFIRVDDATKRLLNVNVDYLDENQPNGIRRVVVITIVLTDLMNQPGYTAWHLTAENPSELFATRMSQLHNFGKEVFGNIINDTMSRRIALTD
ncbi:MAG: hypothetical protein ACRD8U_14950, partial [Pyrinomonadaceae bacterium]